MMIKVNSSVGQGGKNLFKDVKTVQALVNVYLRSINEPVLPVTGKCTDALVAAITGFQETSMKLTNTDGRVDPGGKCLAHLKQLLSSVFKPQAITPPSVGVVTWQAEGSEGGRYHSRKLHVPSPSSGLTIGRGYDMYRKNQAKIKGDMVVAGLSNAQADTLAKAAGLCGEVATQFIIDNDLLDFQVSPQQQKALFKITYENEAHEVQRICEKADVVKLYGKTSWAELHAAIKDVTIDLKFRGDYTGTSRKLIQKSISDNDLEEFKKQLKNQSHWSDVPPDRFSRRVAYLNKAK